METYRVTTKRAVTLYEVIEVQLPAGLGERDLRRALSEVSGDGVRADMSARAGTHLRCCRWLAPLEGDQGEVRAREDDELLTPPEGWLESSAPHELKSSAFVDPQLLTQWRGASVYLDGRAQGALDLLELHDFFSVRDLQSDEILEVFNQLNIIQAGGPQEADIIIYRAESPRSHQRALSALSQGKRIISRDQTSLLARVLSETLDAERLAGHAQETQLEVHTRHQEHLKRLIQEEGAPVHTARPELPFHRMELDHRAITQGSIHLVGEPSETRQWVRAIGRTLSVELKESSRLKSGAAPSFVRCSRGEDGEPDGAHVSALDQKRLISFEPHIASLNDQGTLMVSLSLSEGERGERRDRESDPEQRLVSALERHIKALQHTLLESGLPVVLLVDDPKLSSSVFERPFKTRIKDIKELNELLLPKRLLTALDDRCRLLGLEPIGAFKVNSALPSFGAFLWRLCCALDTLRDDHLKRLGRDPLNPQDPSSAHVLRSMETATELVRLYKSAHPSVSAPLTMRRLPSKPVRVAGEGWFSIRDQLWGTYQKVSIASTPVTQGLVYELKRALGALWPDYFQGAWLNEKASRAAAPIHETLPEGRFSFVDALLFANTLNHALGLPEPYEVYEMSKSFVGEESFFWSPPVSTRRVIKPIPAYALTALTRRRCEVNQESVMMLAGGYAYQRSARVDHQKDSYRLPSREEWLYAAHLAYPQGAQLDGALALSHASSFKPKRGVKPALAPIALGQPNAFGCYDLFGGVREWVEGVSGNQAYAMGGSYLTSAKEALNTRPLTPQCPPQEPSDLGLRLVLS